MLAFYPKFDTSGIRWLNRQGVTAPLEAVSDVIATCPLSKGKQDLLCCHSPIVGHENHVTCRKPCSRTGAFSIQCTLVIKKSLGPMKFVLYNEISLYQGCKNNKIQRKSKIWDQRFYFFIMKFCYISVLYNESALYTCIVAILRWIISLPGGPNDD